MKSCIVSVCGTGDQGTPIYMENCHINCDDNEYICKASSGESGILGWTPESPCPPKVEVTTTTTTTAILTASPSDYTLELGQDNEEKVQNVNDALQNKSVGAILPSINDSSHLFFWKSSLLLKHIWLLPLIIATSASFILIFIFICAYCIYDSRRRQTVTYRANNVDGDILKKNNRTAFASNCFSNGFGFSCCRRSANHSDVDLKTSRSGGTAGQRSFICLDNVIVYELATNKSATDSVAKAHGAIGRIGSADNLLGWITAESGLKHGCKSLMAGYDERKKGHKNPPGYSHKNPPGYSKEKKLISMLNKQGWKAGGMQTKQSLMRSSMDSVKALTGRGPAGGKVLVPHEAVGGEPIDACARFDVRNFVQSNNSFCATPMNVANGTSYRMRQEDNESDSGLSRCLIPTGQGSLNRKLGSGGWSGRYKRSSPSKDPKRLSRGLCWMETATQKFVDPPRRLSFRMKVHEDEIQKSISPEEEAGSCCAAAVSLAYNLKYSTNLS
ncbi:unnamed protein product [Protopolystoma xenopodis]|uniref:Uncharacterized protein n=1 Tax=Protopolystoma xenopodis TaxID=117903 RepID=A0A3S5AZZ8_9PLAT|nr:unnamed protein product [Protopolystoma xenopodis]